MIRPLVIVVVAVGLASSADAATIFVDASNCPGPGSGTPGDPYCSIQTAIGAAASGVDDVEVAPGTYFEAINLFGKVIAVRSSGGPAVTTIDGGGAFHVVQCVSGEGAGTALEGFTITGGNANGSSPDDVGGGMYNFASSPTVTGCVFLANDAGTVGGGMYNLAANPTVTNCRFVGNTATLSGGGMANDSSSSPSVTNCTFSGNTVLQFGGGMSNELGSDAILTNCTFSGNMGGGGLTGVMYNLNADPTLTNCVLWGNGAFPIFDDSGASSTINHSDVEGGWAGSGINNIDADALYVDPDGADNLVGTEDDDLRLMSGSPCIDAGDDAALPPDTPDLDGDLDTGEPIPLDLDGLARIQSCRVDMGAYESAFADGDSDGDGLANCAESTGDTDGDGTPDYLDPDSDNDGVGDGLDLCPGTPPAVSIDPDGCPQVTNVTNVTTGFSYDTIQDAIDNATGGHVIELAQRTYNELIDFNGMAITLRSTDPLDPAVVAATIIDGQGAGTVVTCATGEGAGTVLDGLTITGGSALEGGGMYNDGTSPTVTNCTFSGNSADRGAGMFNDNGAGPTVTSCTFSANIFNSDGGGMYNRVSSPTVSNCTLIGNSASRGGGMYNFGGSPIVTNCTFSGNIVTNSGGAMYNAFSTAATVTNCSFGGNAADSDGGAMYWDSLSATVINCILWGNSPDQIFLYTVGTTVSFSDVQGGFSGNGNIDVDPLFVDADGDDDTVGTEDDDLRLMPLSPCVDAASNGAVPPDTPDLDGDLDTGEPIPFDLDGTARILDGTLDGTAHVDMGAYELDPDASPVVLNITTATLYDTVAAAIGSAADADELLVSPGAFAFEPDIDLLGKALSMRGSAAIDQPAGGLYVLADGSSLSSADGQDVTLGGELRVRSGESADVAADQLIAGVTGELVARTNAGLFVTTDSGVTLDGDATLLAGATMGFDGNVALGGSLSAISGAVVDVSGTLSSAGTTSLLNGVSLLSGPVANSGLMQMSTVTVLADGFDNLTGGQVVVSGDLFTAAINDGELTCIGDTLVVGDYTNNDTTTVQIGTLTIIGTLVNNGTIVGDVVGGLGPGGATQPGDGLTISGDYVAGAAASLVMPDAVWVFDVGGDYDVAIDDNTRYHMAAAELRLTGVAQTLERMSTDIGPDPAGLDRALPGHFPIGTLRIGPTPTVVTTTDNHDNDGLQGPCEAVYVDTLIVEAGATLDTNGCPIYYSTAVLDGTVIGTEDLIEIPPPCPWDCDGTDDGVVGVTDLLALLGQYDPMSPNNCTGGSCDYDGSGCVDVVDLLKLLAHYDPAGAECP